MTTKGTGKRPSNDGGWNDERREKAFWDKVDRKGPDECWLWKEEHYKDDDGYAHHQWKGKKRLGHRIAYALANGIDPLELDPELEAAHSCNVRHCCNPKHITMKDKLDNLRDRQITGTIARGENNGHAVLTEEQVIAIRVERNSTGLAYAALAERYTVCKETIAAICQGRLWSHIEGPIEQPKISQGGGACRFTEAQVLDILKAHYIDGQNYSVIARATGQSVKNVSNICQRKTWKHVPLPEEILRKVAEFEDASAHLRPAVGFTINPKDLQCKEALKETAFAGQFKDIPDPMFLNGQVHEISHPPVSAAIIAIEADMTATSFNSTPEQKIITEMARQMDKDRQVLRSSMDKWSQDPGSQPGSHPVSGSFIKLNHSGFCSASVGAACEHKPDLFTELELCGFDAQPTSGSGKYHITGDNAPTQEKIYSPPKRPTTRERIDAYKHPTYDPVLTYEWIKAPDTYVRPAVPWFDQLNEENKDYAKFQLECFYEKYGCLPGDHPYFKAQSAA